LIDGDLPADASGISACTRRDFDAVLGPGEDGSGKLSGTSRAWTRYVRAGGPSVRVWWSSDHALLIVVDNLVVHGDAAALVTSLGSPASEGPSRTKQMDWTIADLVYPARGLTLSVADSLATPPAPRRIAAAYLYEPTTLDAWGSQLGGHDEWVRRFPR